MISCKSSCKMGHKLIFQVLCEQGDMRRKCLNVKHYLRYHVCVFVWAIFNIACLFNFCFSNNNAVLYSLRGICYASAIMSLRYGLIHVGSLTKTYDEILEHPQNHSIGWIIIHLLLLTVHEIVDITVGNQIITAILFFFRSSQLLWSIQCSRRVARLNKAIMFASKALIPLIFTILAAALLVMLTLNQIAFSKRSIDSDTENTNEILESPFELSIAMLSMIHGLFSNFTDVFEDTDDASRWSLVLANGFALCLTWGLLNVTTASFIDEYQNLINQLLEVKADANREEAAAYVEMIRFLIDDLRTIIQPSIKSVDQAPCPCGKGVNYTYEDVDVYGGIRVQDKDNAPSSIQNYLFARDIFRCIMDIAHFDPDAYEKSNPKYKDKIKAIVSNTNYNSHNFIPISCKFTHGTDSSSKKESRFIQFFERLAVDNFDLDDLEEFGISSTTGVPQMPLLTSLFAKKGPKADYKEEDEDGDEQEQISTMSNANLNGLEAIEKAFHSWFNSGLEFYNIFTEKAKKYVKSLYSSEAIFDTWLCEVKHPAVHLCDLINSFRNDIFVQINRILQSPVLTCGGPDLIPLLQSGNINKLPLIRSILQKIKDCPGYASQIGAAFNLDAAILSASVAPGKFIARIIPCSREFIPPEYNSLPNPRLVTLGLNMWVPHVSIDQIFHTFHNLCLGKTNVSLDSFNKMAADRKKWDEHVRRFEFDKETRLKTIFYRKTRFDNQSFEEEINNLKNDEVHIANKHFAECLVQFPSNIDEESVNLLLDNPSSLEMFLITMSTPEYETIFKYLCSILEKTSNEKSTFELIKDDFKSLTSRTPSSLILNPRKSRCNLSSDITSALPLQEKAKNFFSLLNDSDVNTLEDVEIVQQILLFEVEIAFAIIAADIRNGRDYFYKNVFLMPAQQKKEALLQFSTRKKHQQDVASEQERLKVAVAAKIFKTNPDCDLSRYSDLRTLPFIAESYIIWELKDGVELEKQFSKKQLNKNNKVTISPNLTDKTEGHSMHAVLQFSSTCPNLSGDYAPTPFLVSNILQELSEVLYGADCNELLTDDVLKLNTLDLKYISSLFHQYNNTGNVTKETYMNIITGLDNRLNKQTVYKKHAIETYINCSKLPSADQLKAGIDKATIELLSNTCIDTDDITLAILLRLPLVRTVIGWRYSEEGYPWENLSHPYWNSKAKANEKKKDFFQPFPQSTTTLNANNSGNPAASILRPDDKIDNDECDLLGHSEHLEQPSVIPNAIGKVVNDESYHSLKIDDEEIPSIPPVKTTLDESPTVATFFEESYAMCTHACSTRLYPMLPWFPQIKTSDWDKLSLIVYLRRYNKFLSVKGNVQKQYPFDIVKLLENSTSVPAAELLPKIYGWFFRVPTLSRNVTRRSQRFSMVRLISPMVANVFLNQVNLFGRYESSERYLWGWALSEISSSMPQKLSHYSPPPMFITKKTLKDHAAQVFLHEILSHRPDVLRIVPMKKYESSRSSSLGRNHEHSAITPMWSISHNWGISNRITEDKALSRIMESGITLNGDSDLGADVVMRSILSHSIYKYNANIENLINSSNKRRISISKETTDELPFKKNNKVDKDSSKQKHLFFNTSPPILLHPDFVNKLFADSEDEREHKEDEQ